MNNPDEETAVAQFGKGDKYFGICTLLVTMPGLPMFGHGQIEGFEEKYGMEYRRSYRDERPDGYLVDRHEREIFPLLKKRHVFSGSAAFRLYDFYSSGGQINENVFAYSNRNWDERALVLYNNSYYETSGWIRQSTPAIPQDDGGQRQDTLSEALSIHGEERFFCFLREQRSGLWFIRSSKELCERGLFAVLRGYEAQVFLDIHEREDGEGGPWSRRWSRLNHELKGRGMPDPDAAAADMFLEPLYRPFTELLASRRVRALESALEAAAAQAAGKAAKGGAVTSGAGDESAHAAGNGDAGPLSPTPAALKDCGAPIPDFIEAAFSYLDGAEGNFEPFPGLVPLSGKAKRKAAAPAARAEASAEAAARAPAQFSAFLERLCGGGAEALGPLRAPAGENPAPWRELAACALGYGALALTRTLFGAEAAGRGALALLSHWQLDRKLRDSLQALGLSCGRAWRAVEVMKALLGRTCAPKAAAAPVVAATGGRKAGKGAPAKPGAVKPGPGKPGAAAWGASVIVENYQAEDLRRILGLNRYNDITWFNKEAFEEGLRYLSCFLLLEDDEALGPNFRAAAAGGRAPFIAELGRVMLGAEEKSGYRLDELIRELSEN
jgi:hypothetical protein